MQHNLNIALIGYGNAGKYLHKAFMHKGVSISVFTRKGNENTKKLSSFNNQSKGFDMVLICVSDTAIQEVSTSIPIGKYILAHCSGAADLHILDAKHKRRAVFYPLMSMTPYSEVLAKEIPFCLEAEQSSDIKLLIKLVETLGAKHFLVNSNQRKYVHLAAVFAHNFGNFMFMQAQRVLNEQQLDFELILPLLQQQLSSLEKQTARDIQTGPAKRKDSETLQKHQTLLQNETQKELYIFLTKAIQQEYES